MKIQAILLCSTLLILMLSSCQKTSNQSRQFEKRLNINVLTKNQENIEVNLRCWYQFSSSSDKTFDEKGQFINQNENIDPILKATVYSAVRTVIKKYSSKDLYLIEKRTVENEIYDEVKSLGKDSIYGLKTQFNDFLLGEIKYPHIINQAKNSNLLNEYDLLKSKKPRDRLKAIEKLLNEGSETSYSIILEHWADENNQENRDYILKKLSEAVKKKD
ncbi:hypothetical protein I2486_16365 [Cellulophaga sp. E16_2]|uniref:SPFH domain-containing protein n=1 Tax=Cellulophaga sp. E16_2 TaxID=2789297 RepID=UPI001A92CDF8|nr:SPFH domain-containing protein [Cellulophaga sp. E16_2]MBO0592978.1 hypothetical protein [Cellulophaga sp. E16_2]